MPPEPLRAASHLFTVRLWREDLGDDQVEWRGQVTHVLSSEAYYFRCWDQLGLYLEMMAGRDEPQVAEPGQTGKKTVYAE